MSPDNSNQADPAGTKSPELEPSMLKRREIQSPLIVRILTEFIKEVGETKTMEIASTAIQADAHQAGVAMADKLGGNTIPMLHRIVSEAWAAEDAISFDVIEETDKKLSFNVTHCQYAEMYDRLGIKEFGFCLSCSRDEAFIQGFNPRMKLKRTHTIMQGADCCDFRIVVE